MLQTFCFKLFPRHPKKPQDEPRNFEEGPEWVQGGHREGQMTSNGGPWEGNVLQTLCFKVFLMPPKKPQDEARNFEDGAGRPQGGRWEGHVLQ